MDAEEIVLVAKEAKDMVKLKPRAQGMRFEGEPCFCQPGVLANKTA